MADKFSDFQLKEYENISQAHFKTNEMIAAFFRYYILLMALPLTAFGATVSFTGTTPALMNLPFWQWPLCFLLIVFSLLGIMIMGYISGLRAEAILYARQVNSIRNYFFSLWESEEPPVGAAILVLPRTTEKPKIGYFSDHFYIVCSFALIDTLYFLGAGWLYIVGVHLGGIEKVLTSELMVLGSVAAISMLLHFILYKVVCYTKTRAFEELLV